MTDETFHLEMMRLEKLFNRGRALEDSIRDEYKESLAYVADDVLHKSVGAVIDTFKPFPSDPFPSVSTIIAAVMDVDKIVEPEVNATGA
jgi:hypothetical protein